MRSFIHSFKLDCKWLKYEGLVTLLHLDELIIIELRTFTLSFIRNPTEPFFLRVYL